MIDNRIVGTGLFILSLIFQCSMTQADRLPSRYERDVADTVDYYQDQAHADFLPDFRAAHEHYPPKQLALLVFKQEKVMELWANDAKNHWAFIREFDVLAASGGPGPKLREGDRQVPEGIYHITTLNPYSKFDLSMMIDYPDAFDRLHARIDHRQHVGGNIFIHGRNVSTGCVAIGDHAIEDLFVLVYEVGMKNVQVIIASNDLRVGPPIMAKYAPVWMSDLNRKIIAALKHFPAIRYDDEQELEQDNDHSDDDEYGGAIRTHV